MSFINDEKKYNTYAEMRNQVAAEMDLFEQDPAEEFVQSDEMIGYYNDALLDCYSEIMNIYEDYFLTWAYLAIRAGDKEVRLPYNVWASKIRGIVYEDGAVRYTISRIRNYHKFEKIMWGEYAQNNNPWFSYYEKNAVPGQERLIFLPTPQFSTVDELFGSSAYNPVKCWYLRQCNRIPVLGEYAYRQRALSSATFIASDIVVIADSDIWKSATTGQGIKFSADAAANLPAEVVSETVYYIVKQSTAGQIKLATTKANALAGTTMTLTAPVTPAAVIQFRVEANQTLIDNTIVDIPEFANFVQAWVRVRVYDKLKDPGLAAATKLLEQAREQMVSSLTQKIPDDDDEIEGDFSSYNEQSGGFWPGGGMF
jgi:hypothetical protein